VPKKQREMVMKKVALVSLVMILGLLSMAASSCERPIDSNTVDFFTSDHTNEATLWWDIAYPRGLAENDHVRATLDDGYGNTQVCEGLALTTTNGQLKVEFNFMFLIGNFSDPSLWTLTAFDNFYDNVVEFDPWLAQITRIDQVVYFDWWTDINVVPDLQTGDQLQGTFDDGQEVFSVTCQTKEIPVYSTVNCEFDFTGLHVPMHFNRPEYWTLSKL